MSAVTCTIVILVVSVLSATQAWWVFGNHDHDIEAVGPVDLNCLRLADTGSCEFYACLERRFPCGRRSYALNHGAYYCNKYLTYLHRFNAEGQRWVNNTRRCMVRELRGTYQLEETSCRDISRRGFRTLSDCYLNQDFCVIAWDNRQSLFKVFEASDLVDRLEALRVWGEIIDLARGCAGMNLARFVSWALQRDLPVIHG